MIIIGADPGISGAIALLKDGKLSRVSDIPIWVPTGKKRTVDSVMLAYDIAPYANYIFLERAQAMPKQGVSSSFEYGRAFGILEATLRNTAPDAVLMYVSPSKWKRKLGLIGTEKTASIDMCRRLFPNKSDEFKLKKHHNKAEAALIAYYGAKILIEGE